MDLRLMVCVAVLAFASVEAIVFQEMGNRCRFRCPYGYEPDFLCRCRRASVQDRSPCASIRCPFNTRCEVQGGMAVCSRQRIVFPNDHQPVDPITPSGVCGLPRETGLCKAYFPSFYFNSASGRCEEFVYGGCGGNGNRFQSYQECSSRCARGSRRGFY